LTETEARLNETHRHARGVVEAAERLLETYPERMDRPAYGDLRAHLAAYREAEYRAQKEATL
jgi:hypothetical protein